MLEKFPEIISRRSAMLDRFATALDCVDIGFIADHQILDRLSQALPTRQLSGGRHRPEQAPHA